MQFETTAQVGIERESGEEQVAPRKRRGRESEKEKTRVEQKKPRRRRFSFKHKFRFLFPPSFLHLLPRRCARSSTSLCFRARAPRLGSRMKGATARRKPPHGTHLLPLPRLLRHGQESETIRRFLSSPSPSRRALPWACSSAPATRWLRERPVCSRRWRASSCRD